MVNYSLSDDGAKRLNLFFKRSFKEFCKEIQMSEQKYQIQELNLNKLRPNSDSLKGSSNGSIYVIIGKRGSGKSVLIKNFLYAKRNIIPVGLAVSGTEDTNHFYSSIFPNIFIHTEYTDTIISNLEKRQTTAKQYLSNPWSIVVLDDCMHNKKEFDRKSCISLFKNGRHWDTCVILSNQYALDLKPELRTNCDGIFIFKESNHANLKKLYDNYASIIPTFNIFCNLMETYAVNYSCLYVDNQTQSTNWTDCIFYFKANNDIPNFTFGCDDYLWFAAERTQLRDDSQEVDDFIKENYFQKH